MCCALVGEILCDVASRGEKRRRAFFRAEEFSLFSRRRLALCCVSEGTRSPAKGQESRFTSFSSRHVTTRSGGVRIAPFPFAARARGTRVWGSLSSEGTSSGKSLHLSLFPLLFFFSTSKKGKKKKRFSHLSCKRQPRERSFWHYFFTRPKTTPGSDAVVVGEGERTRAAALEGRCVPHSVTNIGGKNVRATSSSSRETPHARACV